MPEVDVSGGWTRALLSRARVLASGCLLLLFALPGCGPRMPRVESAANSGTDAGASSSARVIFFDSFGADSRGERMQNPVTAPPPAGMGYASSTPYGYIPKRWIIVDIEPDGPRRAFWCIGEDAEGRVEPFLRQAGRSRDSIAFAPRPIPPGTKRYTVTFTQWAQDNDYIGYVIGASTPDIHHDGAEFGYERQLPGTDTTVADAYCRGVLGSAVLAGQAKMRRWVRHRIEVEGTIVRWFQDDTLLQEGTVSFLRDGGFFGIRHRYERGTRYSEFSIRVSDSGVSSNPVSADRVLSRMEGSRSKAGPGRDHRTSHTHRCTFAAVREHRPPFVD